jgi:hypothetical protein
VRKQVADATDELTPRYVAKPTLAAATVKFSAFALAIGALIVAFARSRSNVGRSVA